ncbi:DoxX family protein [Streptomyces sp. NPDC090025]|uniref:DoxX family protein n=1 Tax=Streptomyces sp. NPDC090025 TaxID=3365922 RepID=UPI0038369232
MNALTDRLNQLQPYVLGLFRIVVGLLFLCHGAASVFGWLGGTDGSGGTYETGAWPSWYAAAIQLVAGTLLILGLATRPAAFIASGSMAYAYFNVHQPQSLFPLENGGEAAAMFAWVFLLLTFSGPGALALDGLWSAARNPAGTQAAGAKAERDEDEGRARVGA